MMERYFIVSYVGTDIKNGSRAIGQINMTAKNGFFLNRKMTIKVIEEKSGCFDIVITNLIEVTSEDWASWIQDEQEIKPKKSRFQQKLDDYMEQQKKNK